MHTHGYIERDTDADADGNVDVDTTGNTSIDTHTHTHTHTYTHTWSNWLPVNLSTFAIFLAWASVTPLLMSITSWSQRRGKLRIRE